MYLLQASHHTHTHTHTHIYIYLLERGPMYSLNVPASQTAMTLISWTPTVSKAPENYKLQTTRGIFTL